ncbi:uncharacterized protein LOC141655049 [Silene latifolia]|uniref:uncharacterized protein LOC141655049 n=1 Tax=Silene latifolia TaxID=37657 RepID=UPI003D784B84
MKRTITTPITNFFPKRHRIDEAQNHQSSNPLDERETEVEEPHDGETEMGTSSNPFKEPILDRLTDFDVISLPHDLGLRRKLTDFHINDRDIIRREYVRRGPCQPRDHKFPKTKRNFVVAWFDKFKPWLEYSKEKDAAFCFVCYLFKSDCVSGGEAFVNVGFRTWSKTDAFTKHVGNHMSAHNNAMRNFDVFNKQKSSIACCFENYTKEAKNDYRIRLDASMDALRFITLQGLASRGHDESDESLNQDNYLELRKVFAKRDSNVARALFDKKVPGNCTLASSKIQKQIVNVFANETTKKLIEELDGGFFGILADESADISDKEQMALCLRYVAKTGAVKERLLGVVHVGNTTSVTLKAAIEKVLHANSLTLSSVRGQGYDGASNMRGSINGLKTLIMEETPSAYYVHCFAHQLQLALVAVAKKNADCSVLLDSLGILLNVIGSSCKREDILREIQAENVLKALQAGELESGTGLNQEKGLSRPGDTRWGSHFKTILHVFDIFPAILKVLDAIGEFCDGSEFVKVESLAFTMRTFDYVFIGQLMITIFGITNALNKALQKKDQNIVNAVSLVDVTQKNLQKIREDGWTAHMEKVTLFCQKNEICVPVMSDMYVVPGRRRRGKKEVDNLTHFRIEVFLSLIDQIWSEIDDRFGERSKDLLTYVLLQS